MTAKLKNDLRGIRFHFPRFLALVIILILGTGFFVGVRAAAPDMRLSAEAYFKRTNLEDAHVQSNLGLTKDDLKAFEKIKKVKVTPYATVDESEGKDETLYRLYPNFKSTQVNHFDVQEGRLPQKEGEIALDEKDDTHRIGDVITFNKRQYQDGEAKIKHLRFKVVGKVTNPLFMDDTLNRGLTSLGRGTITHVAVVLPSEISSKRFTDLAFDFSQVNDKAYTSDYDQAIKTPLSEVEKVAKDREEKAEKEQKDNKQKLEKAKKELQDQKKKLSALPEVMKEEANKELEKNQKELQKQEKRLDSLPNPQFNVTTREDNLGYTGYRDNSQRIEMIAAIFPTIFFFVAALVSFTSMTQMVEEERMQLGTLKALGYNSREIARRYWIFALLASLIGTTLGVMGGNYLFPYIILTAYQIMFNLPDMIYGFYQQDIFLALGIALLTTVVPTLVILYQKFQEHTADLLRPPLPKAGKAILLERWSGLWKRLSFDQKITLRNVFRFKGRNTMVILGITGAMALLISGFGMDESISGLADLQFSKVDLSSGSLYFDSDLTNKELEKFEKSVNDLPAILDTLPVYKEAMTTEKKGFKKQNVSLIVAKDSQALHDYYLLPDVKIHESLSLPKDGVLVTQKLADLFQLKEGDKLPLKNEEGEVLNVTIKGVVENYIFHSVFMSQEAYQKLNQKRPQANVLLYKRDKERKEPFSKTEEALKKIDHFLALEDTDEVRNKFDQTIKTLNTVTMILILSAGALAFVVLYSLVTINISERMRELSTIKVLGSYNYEVTLYIFREILLLSIVGMALGAGFGTFLAAYILKAVEVDSLVFPLRLTIWNYSEAILLTLFFTLIVMAIVHRRLREVDMVEALKGVD